MVDVLQIPASCLCKKVRFLAPVERGLEWLACHCTLKLLPKNREAWDVGSLSVARRAQAEMEATRRRMEEQRRKEEENRKQREEALRQAEQLRAQEQAAHLQRLHQEKEQRRRESERARERQKQQAREAEERLAQELQRQRDDMQKAKLEKWQRLKCKYPIPVFLQNYINEVSQNAEADAARHRFVNVAFLGDSGTGKSSLIKVVLKHLGVDLPQGQIPKISMEGDGTLKPTRFPLAILGQVSLWDLPGQGTSKIPSTTYIRNVGLKYFDLVCIVTDGRWSEGDGSLLVELRHAGIRCLIVRSKVDLAVDDGWADKGCGQAETLSDVRKQLQMQTGLKPHRIHLTTSRDKFWNDFGSVDSFCKHLRKDVVACLREEAAEQMFDGEPNRQNDPKWAMDDCVLKSSFGALKRKAGA
eukprot:s94_g63.t1